MAIKRFKFRLEKVLQYRERIKEEKRGEVLLCNQKLNEALATLENLQSSWSQNGLREGALMTMSEVLMTGMFTARLKEEIEAQRVRIAEAERAVEEAMKQYVEAAKDAQTLITLKERRAEEYRKYLEAEEFKVLDEMTVQKGNTLSGSAEDSTNNEMEQ